MKYLGVATPPRVTDDQLAGALARIAWRHRAADSPDQHMLTEDPRDVLAFLRRRGARGLLEDNQSHDLEDALTINVWLWWESRRAEMWVLDVGERLDFDRRRLGRPLGIRSGQGVHDRHDRLSNQLLRNGRPSEKHERVAKGTATGPRGARATAPAEPAVPDADVGARMREALAGVFAVLDDLPAESVDDLILVRREPDPRRAELGDRELRAYLAVTLGDLGAEVVDLPPAARAAVDRLAELVS